MDEPRPRWIPLCTAHELRRDFRDVILTATPIRASFDLDSWARGSAGKTLDVFWSSNPPPDLAALRAPIDEPKSPSHQSPPLVAIVLIARSAIESVTAELPGADPLGANLRRLLAGEALRSTDFVLRAFDDRRWPAIGWVGEWREAAPLLERLARLADETLPVLIRGETGTGKEMIARGLHVLGRRRDKQFLAINCAELPETILESELFGHARGAFTGAAGDRAGLFEAAGDGTVFLDEIGELPIAAQAKLLRLLEDHSVRRIGSSQPRPLACRIVAATNRDLPAEVAERRFRADLFYRLRGFEILLRPLRERRADILPLAFVFTARAALRFRKGPIEIDADAKLALLSHAWPGNIRELRQTIEVATLASVHGRLTADQLALAPTESVEHAADEPLLTARAVERAHILRALVSTAGNKMAAAKVLGLSRQSLQRRMIRHGISFPTENAPSQPISVSENGAGSRRGIGYSKEIR